VRARPFRGKVAAEKPLRLGVTALETEGTSRRRAPCPLSARERLPSHRSVHSRGQALADPQWSLNSVPLGPLSRPCVNRGVTRRAPRTRRRRSSRRGRGSSGRRHGSWISGRLRSGGLIAS
jgi:hypothetical protein